ncbi:MAG: nicotinate (nicotinamide) nucleotide adenylyltransferase [Chitinophagaceae bacterium]
MKIGLYFGSFNPIHIGHLIIANHVLNNTELDKIWFVISPQNPFKIQASLLNEYDRLYLVQKALEDNDKLKASEIEFSLPKPSYTSNTLAYLGEKYPSHQFQIIMGSDGFQNIESWHNAEVIIKNYPIIIYKRPQFEINYDSKAAIQVMDAPLLEISATHIRQLINSGKSIKYLVPDLVEKEILENRYYRTKENNLK